jgi:lipopolysaccharide export system permease protein
LNKDIYHFRKSFKVLKKLDKLIVRGFVGPFIACFFITLFVLVLQFFWLWIDDIVGKGLDFYTIGRFIIYVSATLVPLALPLAVLLASIMTFGNLGETFELVAIKSAGIPLLRFMRPLFFVSLLICGVAFLFNNFIIPVAELKMQTLKYDIIVSKPAFDIGEGIFYDKIDGYIIKIGKKEKDQSTIRDVLIYKQTYTLQDDIIVAEKGKMNLTNNNYLEFDLYNGWNYHEKGPRGTTNTEFIRIGFKEYKLMFDLSSFKLNKTDDSAFKNNYQMLSMRLLGYTIDSLRKIHNGYQAKMTTSMKANLNFPKWIDTGKVYTGKLNTLSRGETFKDLLPDSAKPFVLERSMFVVNNLRNSLDQSALYYENEENNLRVHQVAWHEKLTLSVACLVLFLIGAPLGSIIQKGGIGLPLVFAVIFFVIFYLLNTLGAKFVKTGVMLALPGMWMSTYVLLAIGIFLTYKALHDSQLFNREFYYRIYKKIRPRQKK